MRASPPHLLFTSTEMLNRCLADAKARPLVLGDSARRRPRALLLDEVHTYGGVHGGQVAMLLRRWREALGPSSSLHVVGLSATLEAPEQFLADLTGITDIRVVRPEEGDLVDQGAEYALVLRGNPVSGTALLSTTIQTTFLLGRLLEARDARDRSGTSGSRVFAFTDNLDVTNRLYWDLRDAEQGRGGRDPLAVLRKEQAPNPDERDTAGQLWRLPPLLGRSLDAAGRLKVRRTSGQDAGVDLTADVIVATSALEVGFDDPEVGAIVQHKAPRDDAAFIQRKGRAGRRTEMRPWTVVVLSDYGRDRLRYQAYETLFAPTLSPRVLPIDNLHVLKMQAAYVLMDWLADRVPYLNARADLSGPSAQVGDGRHRRQTRVANELREVLNNPRRERDLERHVRRTLGLTESQGRSVMWDPPRAIMTSTIPTLLRRLETRWTTVGHRTDLQVDDAPLPEHAPKALFSDLNLPEVDVVAPRRNVDEPRVESMSVSQALGEFVPGRSSRRFAVESGAAWHWVARPSPDEDGVRRSDVSTWVVQSERGEHLQVAGEDEPRPVLRPWRIVLDFVPRSDDAANARPIWTSSLTPSALPWDVDLPASSALEALVPSLAFHTHALSNEVHAVRAVTGVIAESADGVEEIIELAELVEGDWRPVALGFSADIDAVRVTVRTSALPRFDHLPPIAQRAVRTSWFEEAVGANDVLRARASRFSLGWLAVLYIASVAGVAISESTPDLRSTIRRVKQLGTTRCLKHALEGVFAVSLDEDDESRGVERLRSLVEDGAVIAQLEDLAGRLVDADATALGDHARRTGVSTVAGAIREAFQRLAPTFDAEALVIDIGEPASGQVDVWLSEPDVGSGGTVEEIRRRVAEEPSRFARLVANAAGPTDLEMIDFEVRSAVIKSHADALLSGAFARTRGTVGAAAGARAQHELRSALRGAGINVAHGVLSTLNLRVLRPGSSSETDKTLMEALDLWDAAEGRLGLELDARAVAYAVAKQGGLSLEQVYSLLWPRGRTARGAGLDGYSRYSGLPATDRLLLEAALEDRIEEVRLDDDDAEARVADMLSRAGVARLVATVTDVSELQATIRALLTRSIDVGSVSGHARIVAAARRGEGVSVTLELPEAAT